MSDFLKYKVIGLIKMKDEFIRQSNNLMRQLEKINSVTEELEKIIGKYNLEQDLETDVIISTDFLEQIQNKKRIASASVKWKDLALDTISEFDSFFTTERIFLINKIKYPNEFSDKEKAIRNISSALRYLLLEGKLERFKDGKGKYNYGLKYRHFDNNGNPKGEYFK